MRTAGRILAEIMHQIKQDIKPNTNTWNLEKKFLKLCKKHKVTPACKGYNPFKIEPYPTGLCVYRNDESMHCYPKKTKTLKQGDIATVDTTIKKDGMHVDMAFCTVVGKASPIRQKLVKTAEKALYDSISKIKNDVRIKIISKQIYDTAKKAGFDVIRDFAGHGIGKKMHEFPEIPCFVVHDDVDTLKTGMTVCVEPLICQGNPKMKHLNIWETKMVDGKDFAQFEHTVLVTKNGYEILTTR